MIKITNDNFDLETEFKCVSSDANGAYSFFLGTVRSDLSSSNKRIKGIYLECYEELALAQLKKIRSKACLLYTSPSPRDGLLSRMPSSA